MKAYCYIFLIITLTGFSNNVHGILKIIPATAVMNNHAVFQAEVILNESDGTFLVPLHRILKYFNTDCHIYVGMDTVAVRSSNREKQILIDLKNNRISINKSTYSLEDYELKTRDSLIYLTAGLYKELFDLSLSFNPYSSIVEIKSSYENQFLSHPSKFNLTDALRRASFSVETDSIFKREYHLFKAGTADWGVDLTQRIRKPLEIETYFGFGGEILGGEATAVFHYSTKEGFRKENQYYQWRWVNNNLKAINQVRIGKISTWSISQPIHSSNSISVSNSENRYKPAGGSYRLTDYTQPGWIVELYINNTLTDVSIADAAGFFSFDVPRTYGNTETKLRYLGPNGEERFGVRNLTNPTVILPGGKMEYTFSAGIFESLSYGGYGRVDLNIGLLDIFTIGSGYELVSYPDQTIHIPFLKGTATPFQSLYLSAEYDHKIRTRGRLLLELPGSSALEIDYTGFEPGQRLFYTNLIEELNVRLSTRMDIFGREGLIAGTFNRSHATDKTGANSYSKNELVGVQQKKQVTAAPLLQLKPNMHYPYGNYNLASLIISTDGLKFSPHIHSMVSWTDNEKPLFVSDIAAGIRLGKFSVLRPSASIDMTNRKAMVLKAELQQSIPHAGYLSVIAERDVKKKQNLIFLELKYEIPYALLGFAITDISDNITVSQSARGSFLAGNKVIVSGNGLMTGKSAIMIIPFMDLNHNNEFDEGEQIKEELEFRIATGIIKRDKKSGYYLISRLEPHSRFHIAIDDYHLKQKRLTSTLKDLIIETDPNQLKRVYIPLVRDIIKIDAPVLDLTEISYLDSLDFSEWGIKTPDITLLQILAIEDRGILSDKFYIQAGAFSNEENANNQAKSVLRAVGFQSRIIYSDNLYKVYTGPFQDKDQAIQVLRSLAQLKMESFIVPPGSLK